MPNRQYIRILAFISLGVVFLGGCSSTDSVRKVETTGGEALLTRDTINVQEWYPIANELVANLINSNILQTAPMEPATMKVSFIKDQTLRGIDTQYLTDEIINQLNLAGQAQVTSTYLDLQGQPEDPLAARAQQERDEIGDTRDGMQGQSDPYKDINRTEDRIPYFTLNGSVKEDYVKQGDIRQSTYTVFVSLVNTATGRQVWTGRSTPITKQSSSAAVGW